MAIMATGSPELIDLLRKLHTAREAEAAAKKQREELELEFTRVSGVPEDFSGSRTFSIGEFKVVYKRDLRSTIDRDKLLEIVESNALNEDVKPAFKWEAKLVKKEFDKLTWATKNALAPAITYKMGKESVKLELLDQD